MKRFLTILAAAVFLCGIVSIFAACGGEENYGETFAGALSEQVYSTKRSAAEGFVDAELSGGAAKCSFLNFVSERELSDEETAYFFGEDAQEISDAERGSVHYSALGGAEEQMPLVIIGTEEGYRYFTLPPQNGSRLTNSYYRSVTGGDVYRNCTVETTFSMRLNSVSTLHYQLLKFADDRAYFRQDMPGPFNIDLYLAEEDGGFKIFTKHLEKDDGNYYDFDMFREKYVDLYLFKGGEQYSLSSFESLSDLSSFMFAANFDCSYFEKTSYGFCIPNENYKKVIEQMMTGAGEVAEDFQKEWDQHKVFMEAKYYVTEGRLSKTVVQLTACEGDEVFSCAVKSDFHSFGQTSVSLPEVH